MARVARLPSANDANREGAACSGANVPSLRKIPEEYKHLIINRKGKNLKARVAARGIKTDGFTACEVHEGGFRTQRD